MLYVLFLHVLWGRTLFRAWKKKTRDKKIKVKDHKLRVEICSVKGVIWKKFTFLLMRLTRIFLFMIKLCSLKGDDVRK